MVIQTDTYTHDVDLSVSKPLQASPTYAVYFPLVVTWNQTTLAMFVQVADMHT